MSIILAKYYLEHTISSGIQIFVSGIQIFVESENREKSKKS